MFTVAVVVVVIEMIFIILGVLVCGITLSGPACVASR